MTTTTIAQMNNNDENIIIDLLKCINCQKRFKTRQTYERHCNRKTPCLIRDVSPDDINNPNRCIYCNKIFTSNDHLIRHLKKYCKIKNGGEEILAGKVMDELKQEKLQIQIDTMQAEIDSLKKMITKTSADNTINNTTNNITINNTTYVTNHYMKPNVDYLNFEEILKKERINAPISLIQSIWFDEEHPENHSICLVNKKTKEILVFKDKWNPTHMKSLVDDIRIYVYCYSIEEVGKIPYDNIRNLYPSEGHWMRTFNRCVDDVNHENKIVLDNIITGSKRITKPDVNKK